MSRIERLIEEMRCNPTNVRDSDLVKVCDYYIGEARQSGTSHRVYKTPWAGDPRVNIQQGESGKAKAYQVRQVLASVHMLEGKS